MMFFEIKDKDGDKCFINADSISMVVHDEEFNKTLIVVGKDFRVTVKLDYEKVKELVMKNAVQAYPPMLIDSGNPEVDEFHYERKIGGLKNARIKNSKKT